MTRARIRSARRASPASVLDSVVALSELPGGTRHAHADGGVALDAGDDGGVHRPIMTAFTSDETGASRRVIFVTRRTRRRGGGGQQNASLLWSRITRRTTYSDWAPKPIIIPTIIPTTGVEEFQRRARATHTARRAREESRDDQRRDHEANAENPAIVRHGGHAHGGGVPRKVSVFSYNSCSVRQ